MSITLVITVVLVWMVSSTSRVTYGVYWESLPDRNVALKQNLTSPLSRIFNHIERIIKNLLK